MPSASDELRRLLGAFNRHNGADLSMVLTSTGIPIAHEESVQFGAESFATLTATLMNAAKVLYTGLGRPAPSRILLDSDTTSMVALRLGPKTMFVALGADREKILRGMQEIAEDLGAILAAKA